MGSSVVLGIILLAVLVGPLVWRVPINEIDFAAKLEGPSWTHPLGTDDLGQDVLARLLYGGRISLAVGLCAMFVACIVGVTVGAIAGMSRGAIDAFLMWLAPGCPMAPRRGEMFGGNANRAFQAAARPVGNQLAVELPLDRGVDNLRAEAVLLGRLGGGSVAFDPFEHEVLAAERPAHVQLTLRR